MSKPNGRTFEDKPAVRAQVPLAVGFFGPSGSGKTKSALRLAAGIQSVVGGEVFFIDTEANRALHYADQHNFRHVPFVAPFSPLDYLSAIEHCVSHGAKTIVIDSMSHEHEGPGGVLEMHDVEHERLGGSKGTSMLAWSAPKQARRRLINTIVQLPVNFLLCFRAKEKLKIVRGKEPEPMGFMPIGGDEFIYEMTAAALLLPGAYGVPSWTSEELGSAMMIKNPEQFHRIFEEHDGKPISEAMGAAMAKWAVGSELSPMAKALHRQIADATPGAIGAVSAALAAAKKAKTITPAEFKALAEAGAARKAALEAPPPAEQRPPSDPAADMSPTASLPGDAS
jgi:ABC-type dipeptide/oligopeptide/nickel transport system ATPase subunit